MRAVRSVGRRMRYDNVGDEGHKCAVKQGVRPESASAIVGVCRMGDARQKVTGTNKN